MTQGEDLQLVRSVWEEFMRMNFPEELFHEKVVWHTAADLPDRETACGPAEVARMLSEGWSTVSEPKIRVDSITPVRESIVVVWGGRGTGRASGAPIEWHESHVYRVRDGMVVEVREFRNEEDAVKAAQEHCD